MKEILITGASGLIGGMLARHLKKLGEYKITALNRSAVDDFKCVKADISDLKAIQPAFEGKDVVVHMAVYADFRSAPEGKLREKKMRESGISEIEIDQMLWEGNLRTNIIGVRNVYEAARLAGVKRIVFGSSGAAIGGFSLVSPYEAIAKGRYEDVPKRWEKIRHDQVRPLGVYGASKVFGEALGRHYSDTYDLSILCVRIGSVRTDDFPNNSHRMSFYLSHRDLLQMLVQCIEAPKDLKYDIFMAASDNKWTYYDLEHARDVLGYHPLDSAESSRPK